MWNEVNERGLEVPTIIADPLAEIVDQLRKHDGELSEGRLQQLLMDRHIPRPIIVESISHGLDAGVLAVHGLRIYLVDQDHG